MMKKVEQHIQVILKKTFKDYKTVHFSASSQETIADFIGEFIVNLNKKINLDKAYSNTKTKETELIGNINQAILLSKLNGADQVLEEIKTLITQYRGE